MNTILLKKRDPIVRVLLCLICFPYFFYWIFRTIKATRSIEGKEGWVLETLLYIFVPIYPIYWAYSRCSRLYEIAQTEGVDIDKNNKKWYILLSLFLGKGLIVYLTQYKINKFADAINGEDAFFGAIDSLVFQLIPDCDIMFMRLYRIVTIITVILIVNVVVYNLILVYLGKHPSVHKQPVIYQAVPQPYANTPSPQAAAEIDETIPAI
ncbi:MAG: hypothetical protein R3Y45_04750 [Bacillota bacterium]